MASATYLWAKALAYIEEKHTAAMVNTWFDDVEIIDLKENHLFLYSPSQFRKPILENQCAPFIKEAFHEGSGMDITISVLDDQGLAEYRSGGSDWGNSTLSAITSDFTFDTFVVGPSNKFAHAAAKAVAEKPATSYNPLLIYGDSGLGKTHLLYAIANKVRQNHPEFHIVYIKGDQFTNELIEALQAGKNVEFRNKYRTADLFLVDDIQFIAGKTQTQEEFFHTFNTLFEQKKQIVLTSDRPPDEMSRLEERLRTRFLWGLLADIQPPDYETRVAIVRNKALKCNLNLSSEVVNYIAENITSNVRQLEGTVNKLLAYNDLEDATLNLTTVGRAIKDMFRGQEEAVPTPNLIIQEVAAYYSLDESVLRGTARDKTTAEARQLAMYLIRELTPLSLEDVASAFGKDHTTVMHSISKVKKNLPGNSHLQTAIRDINANINGKL